MVTHPLTLTDRLHAVIDNHPDTRLQLRRFILSSVNMPTSEATATELLSPTTRAQLVLAGVDVDDGVTLSVCRKLIDQRFTVAMTTQPSAQFMRDLHVYHDWTPTDPLADCAVGNGGHLDRAAAAAVAPLLVAQATALAHTVDDFADAVNAADYDVFAMDALYNYLQLRTEYMTWGVSQ